ncbi:MAG TPA: CDP-diacylglycerol--glycerol-3-phosphate 3-phosphatidyltransferase [Thermoanaerobaculia bacterium]|nr:CDP-diacylglycerol--glycerol-3-phosphate 3-phosphatidyltransferase [Thermoanaerobaculia bacterium]
MLNLPNLLSIFRILLVPPLVVVLLTKFDGKEWWGLALFLVAAVMDFLDGFLARRRKQVTRLGTLLDPAADKILVSAAYISLVELNPHIVPSWIVVVIIAREFAVGSLRSFAAAESLVIPAGFSGKIKTVVQIISIALLIIHNKLEKEFGHLAPLSLWVAMLITVYSGIEYFVRFGRLILLGEVPESLASQAPSSTTPSSAATPPSSAPSPRP